MTDARDLRERLLTPGQAQAMRVPGRTDAAVLVPLYADGLELYAVFTKRREDLKRHAGEISFPGGLPDAGEELELAALREAREEIGLDPESVEVVGALPPTPTIVTGYRIYPYVGYLDAPAAWTPAPAEVASVIELSLSDLALGFENKRLMGRGIPFRTATYTVGDHLVWGATARIVHALLSRLGPLAG